MRFDRIVEDDLTEEGLASFLKSLTRSSRRSDNQLHKTATRSFDDAKAAVAQAGRDLQAAAGQD